MHTARASTAQGGLKAQWGPHLLDLVGPTVGSIHSFHCVS
jgi:hypothetical protein